MSTLKKEQKTEKSLTKFRLSKLQRDVLVGILLGDAHLETQNNGKSYRLKYSQAIQHKEYLFYVYSFFKEWCLAEPKLRVRKTEIVINGKVTSPLMERSRWEFTTQSCSSLRFYAQQFYPKHSTKKRVPAIIHRILTAAGFAFWYQDDGSIKSKQSKGLILNTQGFILSDVEKLCVVLKKKLDLECKPRYQKDGYQIYISGFSFEKATKLVENWLSPCMKTSKWPTPKKVSKKILSMSLPTL